MINSKKNTWKFLVLIVVVTSCSSDFHKNTQEVVNIIDGNTIQVRNGVTIHLIGVNNTENSYQYLKSKLLNKKVKIKYDTKHRYRVRSKYDEIYAYVSLNNLSVNGDILRLKISGLNEFKLNDSLINFQAYGGLLQSNNSNIKKVEIDKVKNLDLKQLVEQTEESVFLIMTYDRHGKVLGTGTGFFVKKNGLALSNYHVFKGAESSKVKTLSGDFYDIEDIKFYDEKRDLIAFNVENIKVQQPLKLSNSVPAKGEDIFVLGNPKGLESTVSKGVVSAIRTRFKKNDFIQIDAPISPGSSGSPVLDMTGRVVGIATSKILNDCESCNFAINISDLNYKLRI